MSDLNQLRSPIPLFNNQFPNLEGFNDNNQDVNTSEDTLIPQETSTPCAELVQEQDQRSSQSEVFKVPAQRQRKTPPLKLQTNTTPVSQTITSFAQHTGLISTSYDTTSPDYDSIIELPTPISRPNISSPHISPGRKNKAELYGSLGMKPIVPPNLTQTQNQFLNNRIVSEFVPSDVSSLPTSKIGGHHPKRFVSTPISEENDDKEKLPREETSGNHSIKENEIIYQGTDLKGNKHQWIHVKQVGKGNFSIVVLGKLIIPEPEKPSTGIRRLFHKVKQEEQKLDSVESLSNVAIKIVHLKADPKNRNRVESSLTRELDLLKIMNHPSIIKLVALNIVEGIYYIFTPFHQGGDLFELASLQKLSFPPILIRRIFAELASAVKYLHQNYIVHRDIKLENVLINHPANELLALCDSKNFNDKPIITLTDFGLSRTIDPESPLLTTRCGSEDYVPPELLIGLPYDGRQTDSWALGVSLYALMENRLPFDLPPNKTVRNGRTTRATHRIARIEWCWVRFAEDEQGVSWNKKDWEGAKRIVEGLLVKRDKRLSSAEVCQKEYVYGILDNDIFLNDTAGLKHIDGG